MTTTPTPFIEEKVNEGRFLSALSLKEQVLADGVLPNSQPLERFSLVKGILTGLLEQGRWQEAVKRVYTDGSIVRGLFDGNWEEFRQGVLESAKRKGDRSLNQETIDLLLKHKESSLLYQLITELPIDEQTVADLLRDSNPDFYRHKYNQFEVSEQQRRQAYSLLGQRKLKEKGEGSKWPEYRKVFEYFAEANDREAMVSLYQTLLDHIRKEDIYIGEDDIHLLITTAEFNKEKAPERAEQIVSALLQKLGLADTWNKAAQYIYDLTKKYQVALSPQDRLTVMTTLAQIITEWGQKRMEDPELSLLWAQLRAKEFPSKAYAIFQKQNYRGPEVLTAVKSGLELHQGYYLLKPNAIRNEDLQAVYPTMSLEIQVDIARHWKDQERLRELSKKFPAKVSDFWKGYSFLTVAYSLWLEGNGEKDDPHFRHMRTALIEKELSGTHPSFAFLGPDDQVGRREAFNKALNVSPATAYKLALSIEDETMLQQARQGVVARNPVEAFRYFQGVEKDPVGIQLALAALEQVYKIPRSRIEQYLEQGK